MNYEIEPMYGNKPVELEYEVHYSYDPGDRDTPPYEEWWIKTIKHRGREVDPEALIRLFSIHHGCHMTWESIESMICEHWEEQCQRDADDYAERQAEWLYDDLKAEGRL